VKAGAQAGWISFALCVVACGGATAEGSARTTTPNAPPSEPAQDAPPPEPEPEPAPPGTVQSVQAGGIPRAALLTVLSGGVGRFLQQVRAEAKVESGRFVGWRIVKLFGEDLSSPPSSAALRPGDVVLRVNGQSIERPEQFKNVWDSLATASEIVLQSEREGAPRELRYRIVD
jgi:hypothetical protein